MSNEAQENEVNLFPVRVIKFSKSETINGLSDKAKRSRFAFVERFIEQLNFKSTRMHSTLLDSCLQHFWIGNVSSQISSRFETVVGTDIQGLFSAVMNFSGLHPVVYDAQEITTFAFPGLSNAEKKFWMELERELVEQANLAVTVSPGIARWQDEQIGSNHYVLPNFESLKANSATFVNSALPIKFVYYGGCAEEKNIASLLQAWQISKEMASLTIVTPRSSERTELRILWRNLSRPGCKVVFTSHDEATSASRFLSQFDVGVIPYSYGYPYSEASPNKFGQYIAAGLCVVSNSQGFVTSVVKDYGLGVNIDLNDSAATHETITKLADPKTVDHFKMRTRAAFKEQLNWDTYFQNIAHIFASVNQNMARDASAQVTYHRQKVSRAEVIRNVQNAAVDTVIRKLGRTHIGARMRRRILDSRLLKR